jgi:Zn-dependent protease with chaperone function
MISAHYFDGRHARAHAVEIATAEGLLTLRGDVERSYEAAATRIAEPFSHAPTVLYFADGTRCEVPGADAGQALREALDYRATRVVRLTRHTWAALAALVLLVALILATAIWGVPAAATRLADALPPSVDQALGESALEALHTSGTLQESRLSDQWLAEADKAFKRVAPPDLRVRLLVRKSDSLGANAIALPDGTIVMSDLMVRLIAGKTGEFGEVQQAQLAGVLAHEIGHVRMRHGTRILGGSSLSAALAASLFGDFSGVAALPAAFVSLSYSREMEAEADEYAIVLMKKNGISTLPLARLLDRIDSGSPETREEEENGAREWLWEAAGSLLRSHPQPEQRAARLRAAAQR